MNNYEKIRTNLECFRIRGNRLNYPNKQVESSGQSCRLGKVCVSAVTGRFVVLEDCRRLNSGGVSSGSIVRKKMMGVGETTLFSWIFFYLHRKLACRVGRCQTEASVGFSSWRAS